MTPVGWTLARRTPDWLSQLEPLTTGLLGQEDVKLWVSEERVAIGIRAGGVVYPVLGGGNRTSWETGARVLLNRVTDSWCLMGPQAWVERMASLMPPSVLQHRMEYEFLARPHTPLTVPEGPGVVRCAGSGDANALFPLQEGYEKEEVLFDPNDFQPLSSRLHLGKLLRNQLIVAMWENGKPMAKAGTNALTNRWGQIGGVYTRPEHRGQGRQKRLMAYLLERLYEQGRGACLFVKKNNLPALELYRALGFLSQGDFLILYGDRKS